MKKRLDLLLVEKGLVVSRQKARALIMAGKVLVGTQRLDKPGVAVSADASIKIQAEDQRFVSRGGLKLEAALDAFDLSVVGLVCLDVGASTGGFSDCLLQHGARHIYAVDVGYGQLAWQLRQDPRVTAIERTNIRHMTPASLPEQIDLATIDVSFISLRLVIPVVMQLVKPRGKILALIKPQFEVGKGKVGKGGVVKDPQLHVEVCHGLTQFFRLQRLQCGPLIPSPILGPKGNKEFIVLLTGADSVL